MRDTFFRRGLALLVALALTCLIPLSAFAEGTSGATHGRTVVIGYTDYAKFIEQDENGVYSGYGVDFLERIAKKAGWTIEYKHYNWTDLIGTVGEDGVRTGSAVANGEVDFIIQAQQTEEREHDFLFADYPTGYEATIGYTLPENTDIFFHDDQGLQGKRIALLENSYQTDEFNKYAEGKFDFTPVMFSTDAEMYAALQAKQVDVMINGSLSSFNDLKVVEKMGAAPYYAMTTKNNTELMDEFNFALGDILAEDPGFTGELNKQHYGTSASNSSPLFTREEVEFIANAGEITVGQHPLRKPISQLNGDGGMTGINEDILDEISKISGLQFRSVPFEAGAWPLEGLRNGDYQLACGLTETQSYLNDRTLLLSDPFLNTNIVPVVQKNYNYDPTETQTIALPSAFQALHEFLNEKYPHFTQVFYASNEECLQAVANNEADVTMLNEHLLNYLLQSPRFSGLETVRSYLFEEKDIFVGLADTTDPLLISIINKSIDCLPDDTVNQIVVSESAANYYEYSWDDTWYQYGSIISLVAFLALLIIALGIVIIITRQRALVQEEAKNAQLAETTAMAQTAASAKSDFLAQMSHEIRTPMNAIIGLTSIAKTEVDSPTRTLENLSKIDLSSKMLLSLINDILDMTAIENKKMKIASVDFNFKQLLSRVATVFYAQCKQKNINFEVRMSGQIDEILVGDETRVNQILLNMLSNAVKFTSAGGNITLGVAEERRTDTQLFVRFTVEDDGAGMTEDMRERLFKPFEQESATTARKHGGSGLGMSITKNLVDMMHGSISVKSTKGEGSTFTVDLPFGLSDESGTLQASEQLKNIRALVVDDDEDTLDYTALVLDRLQVSHDTANTGDTALEMIGDAEDSEKPYDVVFLDWKMPDMDGLEVTKAIRDVFGNDTVIIIVSAYDLNEVESEGIAAGANYFIPKPLFQSTAFDVLSRACKGIVVEEPEHNNADYDFTGHTVMIAEDVAMNMEVATRLLNLVNCNVICAEDGAEAVKMFEKSEPGSIDCILMDVNMPEMNGYEATSAIRLSSHPDARSIPIYAMTANAFTEDVADALNSGMNGHLAKPIDSQLLYKTLADIFSSAARKTAK